MKRVKMLPILVGLLVCSALLLTTCGLQDALDKWEADSSKVGVYVGVFSYDGNDKGTVNDLVKTQQGKDTVVISGANSSLAYLDAENNVNIKDRVLPEYKQGNTTGRALLWAVDKVIANLKGSEAKLNAKLDNVTIISFSSGRDQISVDLAGPPKTVDSYRAEIKNKIDTTTIKDKPINAYSVILSATDDPADEIKRTAQAITSGKSDDGSPAPFSENSNIIIAPNLTLATLQPIFEGIATGLPGIKTSKSVTVTINGPGSFETYKDDGCNFAAVFNGKTPADPDAIAIKGFVQKNNDSGKYEITSIKYIGLNAVPPASVVENKKVGTRFDFNFPGADVPESINQFRYDGSSWNAISGANSASNVQVIKGEAKTAVVVLILDASLESTADITSVRNAATAFVQKLYDESKK